MQTMPSKNRASMAMTGIALLVLVVGLIAYGMNQRAKNEAKETDPMTQMAEPENGTAMQPDSTMNAAATPAPEMGTAVDASPRTDSQAVTAKPETQATAKAQTTPALSNLGAVPATHVVQANETLYSISMKYYNNHIYAGDIEQLNNLTDPNQIRVGMELKLPRPEELTAKGQ